MYDNPIKSCLWYDGIALEAAQYYCSVFPNSKVLNIHHLVVEFELNGTRFMGLNAGSRFKFNPSFSFTALFDTIEQTNEIWGKLIEGGKALMAIDKYEWSSRYGWLEDKYGMSWQITVAETTTDTQKIIPSLLFTDGMFGKAGEAIRFYTSVFPNSFVPLLVPFPEDDPNAGKVMYSEVKLNNHDLIAMDGVGAHGYAFNEAVSLVVDCNTQEEIDYYWNRLTEGGEESMCGWLKDRFGVFWQIVPAITGNLLSDPERGQRVMQEVLKMKKLDLNIMLNA
ncbi:MAG: VOC family protein [Sphingobacteriales bacterium]|nr:MAG: VOC family protein [Sphingobacteriales bacterium]